MGSITVKGKGYALAPPDTVTLSFGVGSKARDYADCLDNLNERTAALRDSASGVDCAELKTTDPGVEIERRYVKDRTFEGARGVTQPADRTACRQGELNRVLGVISQGRSGAEIQIHFSVKDTEDLRQRALAEAVRVARLSAETLAQAAGVKLGKLQSMAHGWDEIRVSGQPAYGVVCDSAATPSVDIDPEDVSTSESVTLMYEFEE